MRTSDTIGPIKRRKTRRIYVGSVAIGGGAPVSVQTMTKTDTRDVKATVRQIKSIEKVGCDIVRLAVPDEAAAAALAVIRRQTRIPLIADIHFDHKLALKAIASGVDGLRINPGNIGGAANVREVVNAARERKSPIRIGVNSGSLEKDLLAKHGGPTVQALVESAMRHVRMLEDLDYREIKISVKAASVRRTVEAYRLLARKTDYPLHLGVTEAGTLLAGAIRTSVALGILLEDGIGDTIRVSLTDAPEREVRVGREILGALCMRGGGASVISCPTCGRIQVDVISIAGEIERKLEELYSCTAKTVLPTVAVMGCMVNGPGEAREADIALAGGKKKFALYVRGKLKKTIAEKDAVAAVAEEVKRWKG
jgi:(E)-4-hydroxy-3-methylbut-2-enyl-diphosphate synthase